MKKCKVVIVIPIFNGGKHLRATLDSALCQTHAETSVIAVNNGSTDETSEVLKEYKTRLAIINVSRPSGMVNDWNTAIDIALQHDADFVKLLPADDIISENCIEVQLRYFELTNVGAVFSPKKIITDSGEKAYPIAFPGKLLTQKHMRYILYNPINWIGEPGSGLIAAHVLRKIGKFNNLYPYYTDLEYWLRILTFFNIAITRENLYYFRLHEKGLTTVNLDNAANEFIQLSRSIGLEGGYITKVELPLIWLLTRLFCTIRKLLNSAYTKIS